MFDRYGLSFYHDPVEFDYEGGSLVSDGRESFSDPGNLDRELLFELSMSGLGRGFRTVELAARELPETSVPLLGRTQP